MQKNSQQKFTAEEKLAILNEAEYGSMSINDVCRRHGISTATYYQWRKQAREAILSGFRNGIKGKQKKSRREQQLENEIHRLRNTVVEITQENIGLKKKHSI